MQSIESKVFRGRDTRSSLIPNKFLLIVLQIILLITVLDLKANHIYWIGINKTHSLYGSKTANAPE